MVIRAGEPWGELGVSASPPIMASDAALAAEAYSRRGGSGDSDSNPSLSVAPGDVLKTVGLEANRPPDEQLCFPFDLAIAQLDGGERLPFVGHLVARRRWWAGTFLIAMNVSWCAQNYFGPKAHPNDGLLDVTTGSLSPRQRFLARRRATTGTHLPHPDLSMVRRSGFSIEFDRKIPVFLDGERRGACQHLAITITPDAFNLVA